jgi:hypothetical protein
MILLRLELKLSNVFVAFDNSAARNVKIVECHRSFDNFAVFRVQFVGYRWFIRQFPKIKELVATILLAVVPQRAPTGYFTSTCIEKARQNDFGGLLGADFLKITFQCTLGGETRLRALLFSPPNRFWRAIPCLHELFTSAPPQAKCKKTPPPCSVSRARGGAFNYDFSLLQANSQSSRL